MKKAFLLVFLSFLISANSFAEENCSRYFEQMNNVRITITDLKDQYNRIGEQIDEAIRVFRSQHSGTSQMSKMSVMSFLKVSSSALLDSYDAKAVQISTKEAELSQLRLIYQDCTQSSSTNTYTDTAQLTEIQRKAQEEKKKLQEMDAYYAKMAKEATEKLQLQIEKDAKLRKTTTVQESRKTKVEQNKKRLENIRMKLKEKKNMKKAS